MKYGALPTELGLMEVNCDEMMFYQYLPIKFPDNTVPVFEPRLNCFKELIGKVCCDFIGRYGLNRYMDSFIYLTAKNLYQKQGCAFNRTGYHSDGFLTDDINYIWSNRNPTVFNISEFDLSLDDTLSLKQMEEQAEKKYEVVYPNNTILCLNQFNIHKVSENIEEGIRCFVKMSFSKDLYDLIGNSHNYCLDYNWPMSPRKAERNIPQSIVK